MIRQVGVVIFDCVVGVSAKEAAKVASIDQCWASIGGNPAFRCTGYDLASNVLWLTNMDRNVMQNTGILRHPNFRESSFLRTPIQTIAAEWGVSAEDVAASETARMVSTLASRVFSYAADRYRVEVNNHRQMHEAFAEALLSPVSRLAPDAQALVDGPASHYYVTAPSTGRPAYGTPYVSLLRNRLEHVREVLSKAVPPDTHWVHVHRKDMPSTDAQVKAMLDRMEGAFLIQCSVTNVNPMVADVFSVAGGSTIMREWLTDVEWRNARGFADISYGDMYKCEAPSTVSPHFQALPKERHAELSYTCGLVADQILGSLVMRQQRKNGSSGGAAHYTAAAAWYRSIDRTVMFGYAQRLHSKGLKVRQYGNGKLLVDVPEGGMAQTLALGSDAGLLAPMSVLRKLRSGAAKVAHV